VGCLISVGADNNTTILEVEDQGQLMVTRHEGTWKHGSPKATSGAIPAEIGGRLRRQRPSSISERFATLLGEKKSRPPGEGW